MPVALNKSNWVPIRGVVLVALAVIVFTSSGHAAPFPMSLRVYPAYAARKVWFRGEVIPFLAQTHSEETGGELEIVAQIGGKETIVYREPHQRAEFPVRIESNQLRCGEYEFFVRVVRGEQKTASQNVALSIRPPIKDEFPILTFTISKSNRLGTLEDILSSYRKAGFNQCYYYVAQESEIGDLYAYDQKPRLHEILNYAAGIGMGLVGMTNMFIHLHLDDQVSSQSASGNYPHTYVSYNGSKRMPNVRHPRVQEEIADRLRNYAAFAKKWPVIRGVDLDDEATASWYNMYAAMRMDQAPKGAQWWGNGDYSRFNEDRFRERFGQDPPRYAQARQVTEKYPPGTVLEASDPWLQWMTFTGETYGSYHDAIVPIAKSVHPTLRVMSQPQLNINGLFWGTEWRAYHRSLDAVNFHSLGYLQPCEAPAMNAIFAQSIAPGKPVVVMVQTANFEGSKKGADGVYAPDFIMQQFWGCIGAGVKGIGDQGEFDLTQNPETLAHWTEAAHDVTDLSPLLLSAQRPPGSIALVYSDESEWMQSAYQEHAIEIWRQYHTFEMLAAAMMRAHLAFDIITTSQAAQNPDLLGKYNAVVLAACDYASRPVLDALQKAKTRIYVTPESALSLPNAIKLKHNFNELYLLFRQIEARDRRTYDHVIDQRAAYLNETFGDIKRNASAATDDVITHVLNVPGAHLLTLVNATCTWPDNRPVDAANLEKIRKIVGENFELKTGPVLSPEVRTTISTSLGSHVYDLRRHSNVKAKESSGGISFDFTVPARGEGALLLVTHTAFQRLRVSEQTEGSVTKIRLDASDADGKSLGWALPVRIDVIAPDGKRAEEHSTRAIIAHGQLSHAIQWAGNEISGEWKIVATELATGQTASAQISR